MRLYRQLAALVLARAAFALFYAAGVFAGFFAHARATERFASRGCTRASRSSATLATSRISLRLTADLFFAQGFVEGSDRLFQMELTRRYALGTLAEVLGPRALPMDEDQRYYDVADVAQREWRGLGTRERAALTAFSAGVNAAMRQQPLPVEFRLLLYQPRPVDAAGFARGLVSGLDRIG